MSVNVPTTYSPVVPLEITPGEPILSPTWVEQVERLHYLYARSGTRIPLYWGDGVTTTSATFERPGDLSGLTGVWRPTRVTSQPLYLLAVLIYGDDVDVRVTTTDARLGLLSTLNLTTVSCASGGQWQTALVALTPAQAVAAGEPIPLGITLEVKTTGATGLLYQAQAFASILDGVTL